MKAIVYIDGYNLYYGLLKEDIELLTVKYFTAPVKTFPYDLEAVDRQKIYLQALIAQGKVQIVQGFYAKHRTWAPAADERCSMCDVQTAGLVPIYKLEEKRSDVNLAVAMVTDAAMNAADVFLVITGDSDQVGAIESVRRQFKKSVIVFNPQPTISKQLDWAALYYNNIPRDLPARCQLPDEIPVGTHGNVIRRPAAWR